VKNYIDKHKAIWENSPIKNRYTTELWGRFRPQPFAKFGELPNILDKTRQLFNKEKKKLILEKFK